MAQEEDRVTVRGIPLALHPPGDWVSDFIRGSGDFYEPAILDELARRVRGGVLIDAGAMIGNHAVFMAEFVAHSAIHAFEPAPENLAVLLRNVALYPSITVHPVALSDSAVARRMTVEVANKGHGQIYPDGEFEVEARTLDSFAFTDVSLIKLDVEWHEPEVLAGARETIDRWHPLIVIEDWKREYAALLPGYRLAVEWETAHQTFMYEWAT